MTSRALTRFHTVSATQVFARIAKMLETRRQRLDLACLDAHSLHDIGLTRADALSEASRPMWDISHG